MSGQLAISEAILHKTNLLSISSILNLVQHSNNQEHSLAAIHIQKMHYTPPSVVNQMVEVCSSSTNLRHTYPIPAKPEWFAEA